MLSIGILLGILVTFIILIAGYIMLTGKVEHASINMNIHSKKVSYYVESEKKEK